MSLSNWLCNKSSKSQFVKIVYAGGHVELHERPVLAAEIMLRNPKCYVAHPNVFQKPWSVVEPETELLLGQKFYVVPMSTVRKLQRFSLKYSPVHRNLHLEMEGQDHDSSADRSHKEGFFSDRVKYCFFWALKLREFKGVPRKRDTTTNGTLMRGSPKRLASLESNDWHPNLAGVAEE